MGRRSRALEQVLGEVITQAVTEVETSPPSKLKTDAVAHQAIDKQQQQHQLKSVFASTSDNDAEQTQNDKQNIGDEDGQEDVDEAELIRRSTVGTSHPQFDTSQAVMHGIAHSLNMTTPISNSIDAQCVDIADVDIDPHHHHDDDDDDDGATLNDSCHHNNSSSNIESPENNASPNVASTAPDWSLSPLRASDAQTHHHHHHHHQQQQQQVKMNAARRGSIELSSGTSMEPSMTGSVRSLGRAPSSVYFRPDGNLTLEQFREAITQQHEVRFAVGKGGKALGKASLSTSNIGADFDEQFGPKNRLSLSNSNTSALGQQQQRQQSPQRKRRSMRFGFKTYAGAVFARLRANMSIDTSAYLRSLAGGEAFLDFVSNSKSGQFFFFTDDRRYMIKTMSQHESVWFRHFLPDYYQHVIDYPNSLLVRIVGLYRLQCRGHGKLHFMVMRNVFASHLPIHTRFDLKGSTVGRHLSQAERRKASRRGASNIVLKDLDFDNLNVQLRLGAHRPRFVSQMHSDAEFLRSHMLMDYSMLVGIYRRSSDRNAPSDADILLLAGLSAEESNDEHVFDERGVVSRDETNGHINEVYFFGVIDFLQKYNWRKKTEHFLKSIRFNGAQISAISPQRYAQRFCQFMEKHIV